MARSQVQAAAKSAPQVRRNTTGGGARRLEPDVKDTVSAAPRCWQSGSKSKEPTAAEVGASPPVSAMSPTAVSHTGSAARPQKGWGELPPAERASRCAQLQEMGFSTRAAQKALEECSWDVNKALDDLFNGRSKVDASNDITAMTKHPQTIFHADQPSGRRTGVRSQKQTNQAGTTDSRKSPHAARNMDVSPAGDSTSASGGSTPRLPTSMSPQRDSCSASSADDSIASQEKSPSLPPGLEEVPMLLAAPPGLRDEPTPCANPPQGVESAPQSAFQVPGIVVPPSGRAAGAVSVVPKRKLQKVQHTWECEEHCSTTQLSVEEGTFVYVWSDSKTETGWIYAESLICCNRAGWLPESMLQHLPTGRLWMRVSMACRATHPMQLQVEAGNMVLVDASQDPVNGWVYAEQVASATGRPSLQGLIGAGGWVPIQCVEWAEV